MELAERVLSTRRGTILVAAGAAVLAGILLFVFVREYKNSSNSSAATYPVLVARSLIPAGTPANVVGTQHMYEISSVAKGAITTGAYTDPSQLGAGLATTNIYPGSQLTAADFAAETSSLDTQITGKQRAISIPIDSTRALDGQIVSGDRVDIYVSAGGIRTLLQNVPVLVANSSGEITVQLDSKKAAILALAVDTGKLWFFLRPRVGAPKQPPVIVTPAQIFSSAG